MTATVRTATSADCPQIAEIYRHYVENSVITFDYESPSVDDWEERLAAITARGRPFVVAVEPDDTGADTVLGYAYLGEFRTKHAYDWTTEDSIYLRPDATGRRLGSTLLEALLTGLDPSSVRRVVAVISIISSDVSIRLHQRFGFVQTGVLQSIGYKNGRWIDCAVLQYTVPGTESDSGPFSPS
ncbi:MAG: GNAT family N-acetyltransferase [Corynebacteriales bacterium]|uniref:GNAT family N-acetyltransferase n=1 Tax=Williamsia herbipolensis TaxID=1603258 RepID=A0AAU4K1S8_9NOCA|nr:N-acetyltransferase family protein [Williamsia herbipolensis]MCX6470234.1 GNAT family N-acetyltransferase [Mycobacteriales bacterium]